MKTKPKPSAGKAAAEEDEAEPKKIRSSRSKHRRGRRSRSSSSSSSGSESPPRNRSKKHSKRVPVKKSKRSKVRSSTHRRRNGSLSRSRSLSSSSSPSPVARRSRSTSSSSASERSVSPPPRSRSRDVQKKKGSGRGREKDRKRRKVRRTTNYSSSAESSGSSRSRSRSKKRRTVDGTKDAAARDKIENNYDNHHATRSQENLAVDDDRDENHIAKKGENDVVNYEKYAGLEKMESPCLMNANETEDVLPAAGGNSDAEDLELILRQKALENFRKFRAAAAVAGKTDNGATGKEALRDSAQGAGTKTPEARSAALTNFQRQGSSLGVRHSAGSPPSEDCGNGPTHSWKQASNAGIRRGSGSPGILETGDTGGPTQQEGKTAEATPSTSQFRSPQDGRNSRSVMQRLVSTPGSCASVNQRLGSNAGASHVNGAPRIRSVVSIPSREGLDGSTYTTPPRPNENSATIGNSTKVGRPVIDTSKAEGANGADKKTIEASASNGSIPSPAEGKSQARTEDKDGSEFQKKTFSRMHDGETVEVSYKVYIPKKTPALARRKLQR